MDEKVKDLLEWFEDQNSDVSTLWGLQETINNPRDDKVESDKATLLKIFNEEQLCFIKILINDVVSALKFHSEDDDSVHPDMREQLKTSDAKLRNHRHELDKSFSAKPEF